jgi:hypothetical protein
MLALLWPPGTHTAARHSNSVLRATQKVHASDYCRGITQHHIYSRVYVVARCTCGSPDACVLQEGLSRSKMGHREIPPVRGTTTSIPE